VIAVSGKILGAMLAARLTGESWADSFTLGALVQPRGLMALVVLTILLDRGIITGNTFSALTLMAVMTTLLAMPLARLGLRLSDRQHLVAAPSQPVPTTIND
jgi:Kef-type K+ transport system membrane component KefB